jgi:glycosyltransferase involved in cell wall biosynthesis
MNILYLAHRIPYPPNKGDKIRSFHEIKYLSTRHDIYLACLADDPADLSYIRELKRFCKTVDVVSINPQKQKVKSLFVLPTEKPLSVAYFYSKKLQQIIDRRLSTMSYDAIICFSSVMAEYIFRTKNVLTCERVNVSTLKRSTVALVQNVSNNSNDSNRSHTSNVSNNSNARLIMDFVDVDSDKWRQYSGHARWPFSWIYKLESRRLAAYEKRVADSFHHSIFVSKREAELFRSQSPGVGTVLTMPNGVDFTYFNPNASNASNNSDSPSASNVSNNSGNSNDSNDSNDSNNPNASSNSNNLNISDDSNKPILLFTGAMDYYANVDGVVWFSKEVLPHLTERFPSLTFHIVGRNPAREVRALENEHIKVTGYVEDIRPFYEMATIYVAPLRIARGIQNKILEAMAMARPVIATSKAHEGIEAVPGRDLLIADSRTEFIEKISLLLEDEQGRQSVAASARRTIEENYSWERGMEVLENVLTCSRVNVSTCKRSNV